MNTLRRFFELPTFADEESNTRARVMYTLIVAMIILMALTVVINSIARGVQSGNLGITVVLLLVSVGLLGLLCRGYLRSVVWIFIIMMMVFSTLGVYNLGTIYTHALAG